MEIDVERPETWKTLRQLTIQEQKHWISQNMPLILRTLERFISTSVEYKNDAPWDVIGFICLDDGLYKEAEHIYDEIAKRARNREDVIHSLYFCRGLAKFFQGRYRESYDDFKLSNTSAHQHRQNDVGAVKAITYMDEIIFPMLEMVKKSKEKLRADLNIPRFVDRAVGPNILKTLHRWNSCSSLFSTGISQGGGYLLTLRDQIGQTKSIAIDPGYDFIDMFKDLDLTIVDLDAVIVTHDHDDHTESMEAILSLLAKHNDHVPQNKVKNIDVFGSPGVMLKYQGLFNALDPWGNREVHFHLLIPGSTIDHIGSQNLKEKYGFSLHIKQAFHNELWTHEESAVGVVVETNILDKHNRPFKIGITGDTRYEPGVGEQYKDCDILLFNIGSLEKEEGKLLNQHLGLLGSVNIIKEARPHLAILTEFGEEFRGKRAIVSTVIEDWATPMEGLTKEEEFKVIPADIHLEVRLPDLYLKETSSKVFLPYNMVEVDESEADTLMYRMKEK